MNTTKLIMVGGFLGAGKTTLLWKAAKRITENGKKVGLITNDQAPELVDSALLSHNDLKVAEVTGSCFCCNFNGFLNAVEQVREEAAADIIIAEPVGSCTDLSATILQPLKEKMRRDLQLSPFTVMADPVSLTEILYGTSELHPDVRYIFTKQLEESDIILISKSDLLTAEELSILKYKTEERFPDADVMFVSSLSGEGLDEWLKEVMNRKNSGLRITQVDYDIYARGEAALGWLNCTIQLRGENTDWDLFSRKLMNELSRRFDQLKAVVGHVKIIVESGENYLAGNITGEGDTLNFRGSAGKGNMAKMTLNARVEMSPLMLENIVRTSLNSNTDGLIESKILAFKCLSPGRPKPDYRFDRVVK